MEENNDDIINLPHYVSKKHKQMSMWNRAAQFAPFAALTGYEDAIVETARYTNSKIQLSDFLLNNLNEKLNFLLSKINLKPVVSVIYFEKDKLKDGGIYRHIVGKLTKIEECEHKLVIEKNIVIHFDDIYSIDGEMLDKQNNVESH